jgi:hypothetical protein
LAHEVSILFGVGYYFGRQPGAKISMTIMRAPQHGHGQGSSCGVSGANIGLLLGIGGRRGDIEESAGRWSAASHALDKFCDLGPKSGGCGYRKSVYQ